MKKTILLGILVVAAFFAVALSQARLVNVDPSTHDQSQYLLYAIEQAETHYTALGNRMQMPVYPSLLSLFVHPGHSVAAEFMHAKMLSIFFGAVATAGVWVMLLFSLERPQAVAVGVVYTLFVSAFRSAYVQCEPIYFAIAFAAFLACVRAWKKPSLGDAVLAGATAALAWLTKASMSLDVGLFVAALFVRALVVALRRRFAHGLALVMHAAAFVVSFALIVLPYAINSKACCGSFLYNMSSHHVVWFDSWEDVLRFAGQHGPHQRWHDLPPEIAPSLGNYLHTHGAGLIVLRMARGLGLVVANTLAGTGYQLFGYAWLAYGMWLLRDRDLRRRIFSWREDALWPLAVPWLVLHVAALAFYACIAAGPRFSLALFLPGAWLLHGALAREEPRWKDFTRRSTKSALVLAAIALPILAPLVYAGR